MSVSCNSYRGAHPFFFYKFGPCWTTTLLTKLTEIVQAKIKSTMYTKALLKTVKVPKKTCCGKQKCARNVKKLCDLIIHIKQQPETSKHA